MRTKLVCFALLIAFFACSHPFGKQQEIRIGLYGPLSGNTASFGQTVKKGVELAVEEANSSNARHHYSLVVVDDRGNPEEAQSAAVNLITKHRVIAVLGEPSSSGSLAGAPVCQQYQVPMITPTATNPKVTQVGDYIFRICWIDSFQGELMAKFALNGLHAKRIAILYDITSDYSSGLSEVFEKGLQAAGGQIVKKLSYNAGDSDFSAQITAIKTASPDGIFLPGYYTDVGLIVRQARGTGISQPIIGTDGWDSPLLKNIGGQALNNTYFCTHFFPEDPAPEVQKFVRRFQSRFHELPSMGSALGYDATNLLKQAIKKSGSLRTADIRTAIATTRDFPGVTGTITIDRNRNALKPAVVLRFENGELKFVRRVNPD